MLRTHTLLMRSLFLLEFSLAKPFLIAGLLYALNASSQGTIQYTYGGKSLEKGNDILVAKNGDYILAGESESFGTENRCINLLRLNPSGKVLWSKIYDRCLYFKTNKKQQKSNRFI